MLPFPGWLLATIILSIGLSPRIRVGQLAGERAVDLRAQDFLILIGLTYLLLNLSGQRIPSLKPVWGRWFVTFAYAAAIITVLHMLFNGDVSAVRRISYLGRAIESFLLASVVAGLYLATGPRARHITLRTIHFIIVANTAWFAVQVATGTARPLLGDDLGAVNYGPQLIGEPSAFGAGAFFVFTAALGVAEYRSQLTSRRWAVGLVVAGLVGALLSQSRISIGAAAALLIFLVLKTANDRRPNAVRLLGFLTALALVVPVVQGTFSERLTLDRIAAGFGVRAQEIWPPAAEAIAANPFFGVGPGALGTGDLPWVEAHNIVLRALLDYGMFGALLFFGIFAAVAHRGRRAAALPNADAHLPTFATTARLFIIAMALAGVLQDTYTAVTSTHLMMLATGLFAAEAILYNRAGQPSPDSSRTSSTPSPPTTMTATAARNGPPAW